MSTHNIVFKFTGGSADGLGIDASDGITFHEGARQLVGLYGAYLATGDVPKGGVVNYTNHYRIYWHGAREGCVEFPYIIELFSSAAHAGMAAVGACIGKTLYEELFHESLKQLLSGKIGSPPNLTARIEPVFESQDGNRAPIVDPEAIARDRWRDLQSRATRSLITAMRPVGRSADELQIQIGSSTEILLTRHDLAALREYEITLAIKKLPHRRSGDGYSSDFSLAR